MTNRQRAELEITEFTKAFPDAELDSIPLSVWNEVKSGVRLADAYGKYSEQKQKYYDAARRVNSENADMSSGRISGAPKRAVYTAKEVAAMSEKEVADNYDDILISMRSSGFYS